MKFETLRNGLANLMAGALPILVVIFTTPYVVNMLGSEHYGLLTLITAIIGYFAIIDLNFTAGSLKFVSQFHASGEASKRDQTLTAGFLLYLLIGVVGAALIYGLTDGLVIHVFAVPDSEHALAVDTLELGALGFLLGQMQVYLNSVPQALRRYDQSALFESTFGMLAPLANVLVLWLGGGLYEIVLVRIVLSVLNIVALVWLIRRLLPDSRPTRPTRAVFAPLAHFSGFAYLSRLAQLAYAHGDKLIIGALVSMSALTHYAVPFMLANRVYSLSYRLSNVLLPAASALAAQNDTGRLRELYLYSARYVFFINCVLTTILVTLAHEILYYWIGAELALAGSLILVLIALGNLVDSLTNAPSVVNDGLGHPKITGLFAIGRASLGLVVVFVLVRWLGIEGAAIAQLAVAIVGTVAFVSYVHGRTVPARLLDFLKVVVAPGVPVVIAMLALLWAMQGLAPISLMQGAGLLGVELVALAVYGYVVVFRRRDVDALVARLRPGRLKGAQ